jgi:isopentenyl-diphosphate delta-isomerase
MENINRGLLHALSLCSHDGKLLLQQRALDFMFPDLWTNTCCSHVLDDAKSDERMKEGDRGIRVAASRKLEHELGIPRSQTPINQFQYLARIHYLAPSDGL